MKSFSFFSQFRLYSMNIQSILLWNLLFCLGLGIHSILYNLYLQGIVQDEVTIGRILGMNFLAQGLIYIPAGLFSDRLGSKKGVITGVSILTVALFGNLFATTQNELSFWGFVIGIGHAATIVTFVPLLTEYSTTQEKKSLFTYAYSTGTFFTFLGTLLGGIVSDSIKEFFLLSNTVSIRITLSITVILLVLCMIPLLFVKKNELQRKTSKGQRTLLFLIKTKPKSLLPIVKFSFSKTIAGVSLGIIFPFMNLFFLERFALSSSMISIILAGGTLATVICMSYNSKITSSLSDVKTVSLYHLLSIPAILLLGLSQNIWIAIISFVIYRSANFSLNPIESKIMMEKVEPEIRGLTNSFGFMAYSICISLVGPFAMYLVQIAGHEKGYLFLCIVSSIASLIAAIYFHYAFAQKREYTTRIVENTSV
ncbi:MFS transporter [Fredinandcohnia humi]